MIFATVFALNSVFVGVFLSFVLFGKTLSDERRHRIAAKKSEARFRLIFRANPQPMWIADQETTQILDVNEAAVRHYGYQREEFLSMNAFDLRPPEEIEKLIEAMKDTGNRVMSVRDRLFKHKRKDGSFIDVEVAVSDLSYGGKRVTLVVVKDVTEQVQAENKLRQAIEAADQAKLLAESANQAKTRFLANVSHEIRTPLGAMLGFAELMREESLPESDRLECVETILRNGEQLSHVINDILDLSKIESDRFEIERIEFNPMNVLHDVASLLNLSAKKKGLSLSVKALDSIPHLILSDPTRLKQVLMNMIGNAIKFTSSGFVEVGVRSPCTSDTETNGRVASF